MPFTHVGGVAGKSGTIAMQQKIGKLRKRIAELEQVVVERNQCIRKLRTENKKLRKLSAEMYPYARAFTQLGVNLGCNDSMSYDWYLQLRKLGIEADE